MTADPMEAGSMTLRGADLPVHEACNIFPMMAPDEFAGLVADIRANGQREPIWLYRGEVIDGRNRLKACAEIGIEPQFREWDGDGSLVEFVVSLNLHRRHLSSGQRAACGSEIEERLAVEAKERQRAAGGDHKSSEARPKRPAKSVVARIPQPISDKARDQAARLIGSNSRYIQDAKAVKKAAPDLHEKVKAGKMTLPRAKREVKKAEKRAELQARAEAVAAAPAATRCWEVVTGDAVAVLGRPGGEPARLIFADPPYNIGFDYGEGHDDALPADQYLKWCRRWADACARRLTPDGSLWVLINDEWADELGCMLRRAGLHRRAWIKWYESFGVNCANNFNRCSRHLFYMVKDPRRFVFNADAVTRPSDRQAKYGDKRADPGGKLWDDVWGLNPPIPRLVGTAAERIPDVPTQLPLQLLTAVVGCASGPGDLVIDPFSGSGSTGEAAIRLGRRFLGIDRSETYSNLARMRLTAAEGAIRDEAR
jgi:DNA modification methylase/ParB-like chromosome segregation protein Spo0J